MMKTNDVVDTPNGRGVVQGHMWENGALYIIVRHVLAEMTQKPEYGCMTKMSLSDNPVYSTGLWRYDRVEVKLA